MPDPVDPVKIEEALKKIGDTVKEEGVKYTKQLEKFGEASTETKKIVDEMLTKQGEMGLELLAIQQALTKVAQGNPVEVDNLESVLNAKWLGAVESFRSKAAAGCVERFDISRKALLNTGVTGAALNFPGTQVLATPLVPLLRRLTIRDLLAQGRMKSSVLFYMQETGFTNNAAPVSEGSLKPKSDLTFAVITDPVRTLAHLFDISLQMLDDIEYIASYIETRGRYGLKLVEEAELLNGSGTGQHLNGIYTQATAYNLALDAAIADPSKATDIDKLRLALLQVELANASSTGIILNPMDWAGIELTKDTTNNYLFVNPQNTTQPMLWGRPIVSTQAMTAGKFLTGDFAAYAQIFDRQDANLAISFENKDNFERNMATLRVEERLALAVYRPEAFVKGTLESAS